MCKFNNHLFKFTVLICASLLFGLVHSVSLGDFLEELLEQSEPEQPDYDIHFDQRQNGTENYRLKVDGLIVALPAEVDLDDDGASVPDDLSVLLTGLGVDSENLTNDDLFEILASIASKKTANKEEALMSALNEKVPEKGTEGEENATTLEGLRSPEPSEGKLKKSKGSSRNKNFRVRLPGLFRKFVLPRTLN